MTPACSSNLYVAAYDSRLNLPGYMSHFVAQALRHTPLHLLVHRNAVIEKCWLPAQSRGNEMVALDLESLPFWDETMRLFDEQFINFSTNSSEFERSCFDRWFALNAATSHLSPDDFVCLLDTDILLGVSPRDIVIRCKDQTQIEIDLIADWDEGFDDVICPAITIVKKKLLFHFCEFLLTDYFHQSSRNERLKEYFSRIGNGLPGGVCDMRALGSFMRIGGYSAIKLSSLNSFGMISNFTSFRNAKMNKTEGWQIVNSGTDLLLDMCGNRQRLIGVHCQGSAKKYMRTIVCEGILSDQICSEQDSEGNSEAQMKSRFRRKVSRWFNNARS